MKNAKIKIELLQGDNSPIVLMMELTGGLKNSEISGTLAYRIIKLMLKAKKYKMNLGGFSFARKFDVQLTIDEVSASGSKTLGLSTVKFGIVLQSKEDNINRFNGFINELVEDILCGDSQLEGEFVELVGELHLN